ncbi:MAG: NADH-quinone oxidoreductase subunit NuoE [Thermodesulfovibrionales bacterium]|jgi:NADH:ubiquinone oxidoreductase subunit E|nr:NADH-quinone oxidoreductase subunit NuoE [Thermodesulfovibrionales bacterium]
MKIEEFNVDAHYKEIGEVLTGDQKKRGLLIYAFQQIQKEYNYLPEDKLRELSKKLDIPLADVYSTASFYKHFYFKPRGKNVVCVCMGTACHVRGASKVLEKLEDEFGVREGETTEDMSMTLETVGCVGCCGLAPVVTVNEEVVGDVGPKKVNEIINKVKK